MAEQLMQPNAAFSEFTIHSRTLQTAGFIITNSLKILADQEKQPGSDGYYSYASPAGSFKVFAIPDHEKTYQSSSPLSYGSFPNIRSFTCDALVSVITKRPYNYADTTIDHITNLFFVVPAANDLPGLWIHARGMFERNGQLDERADHVLLSSTNKADNLAFHVDASRSVFPVQLLL